jgi:hypothetical protein
LAVDEENAITRQFAEAHLRTRKIRQDSNWPSNFGSNSTNPVIPLEGEIKRLVRKIDPSDIHSRLNKTLEYTRIVRGWAD